MLGRGAFQTEARKALLNRLPSVLQEREFPTWKWMEYNKAFTCVRQPRLAHPCPMPQWLDSQLHNL